MYPLYPRCSGEQVTSWARGTYTWNFSEAQQVAGDYKLLLSREAFLCGTFYTRLCAVRASTSAQRDLGWGFVNKSRCGCGSLTAEREPSACTRVPFNGTRVVWTFGVVCFFRGGGVDRRITTTWREQSVSFVSHEASGSIGRTHGATILITGGS